MQEGNSVLNHIKILIINIKGIVFTAVMIGVIVALFSASVNGAAEKADSSSAVTLEKATKRAAVQCYAIEGFYPVDIDYLTEHYGVIVDRKKFIVYYSAKMPNYMPVIQVKRFGGAE